MNKFHSCDPNYTVPWVLSTRSEDQAFKAPTDKAPLRHVHRAFSEADMKFGKYLAKRHLDLPEYANSLINYKALKKLINHLAETKNTGVDQSPEAAFRRLQEHKATFFFQLERELEKVQSFYRARENDLELRLEILLRKKQTALKAGTLAKNSVTYISLHEGFQRFRRDLERLEQFIELNATGFSKVLKKWDKRSRSHTKELYLSRAVEVQPMFNRDILVSLSDKVNASLLELEALQSGEQMVFEPAPQTLESSPSDDLYYEFVKFASTYNPSEENARENMDEWITQLKNTDDPEERISQVFILAISTKAADDALLALYQTGFVDLNTIDEYSNKNCLHLAASTKDRMKVIKLALDNKVSASQVDVYGKTPLHYAAIHNRRELIPLFLEAGAPLDLLDNDNFSALHYSIFLKFSELTEDIVDAGAKVTGNSERDYIPLNFACQYGAIDAVRTLLDRHPGLPQVPDAEGLYPIHILGRAGFGDIIPLLTKAGANINELDKLNSWTALMYAASEGMCDTVQVLLDEKADWTLLDERGHSALFYACWEGHPRSLKILASMLPAGTADISRDLRAPHPTVNTVDLSTSLDDMVLENVDVADLDGIPDLSLPPPIIPLLRYGHNFLDSKKVVLQVLFDTRTSSTRPVRFNEDRKFLSAGRMTLTTSNGRDSLPRNITLPVPDVDRVQTFQVENLNNFSIDFEVLPTFGTRVMAKATALPSVFNRSEQKCVLPLMNALLRYVGEVEFSMLVIKPYRGKPLEIAKYDTYWKSTSNVETAQMAYPHGHGHATHNVESFSTNYAYVTGSSLHGEYHKTPIVVTRDKVPVVSDRVVNFHGVELAIPSLTLEQVTSLSNGSIKTLADILENAPAEKQLNLYVPYPTALELGLPNRIPIQWPDINTYVDEILERVFDYVRAAYKKDVKPRPFMFTSSNPEVCAAFNWKQANYPVFFFMNALRTDGRYTTANNDAVSDTPLRELQVGVSVKEASQFAATNNLMGVILPSALLKLVPTAVSATRVLGLVLVASGAEAGDIEGVDAIETGKVMTFPESQNNSTS